MSAIFSALTILLAVVPSAFALEDLLPSAFKNAEKLTANLLAKTAKPSNVTANGDYVLIHYFDVKDCSAGQEIQYVTYKTNSCYNNGASGSTRWSCNGDQVHYDQWSSTDCSGATHATSDYSPDKCFPQDAPTSYILASSFSCSATSSPPGSWYGTATYTDASCNNLYMASLMKNQKCLNFGSYSMRIDYPKEYMYYTSTDCSSASPYEIDLSQSANKCIATTASPTQSTKSYFSQL